MNKGVVGFAVALAGAMGLFFLMYLRDKVSETRLPQAASTVSEREAASRKPAPAEHTSGPDGFGLASGPLSTSEGEEAPSDHLTDDKGAAPVPGNGTIEGCVRREDTDEPVTEFDVAFEPRAARSGAAGRRGELEFVRVTEDTGRFRLERVPVGPGRVAVRAVGFSAGYGEPLHVDSGGTVTDVVVRLRPAVTIDGLVRDVHGARITGALVFRDKLAPERLRERQAVARSGEDGTFRYEPASGDVLRLVVWHPDYAPALTDVLPEPGVPTECIVVMDEGAAVEGKVWYGREAMVGQRVEFTPKFDDFGFTRTAETGSDGGYRLTRLPACDAAVTVTLAGDSEAGRRTRQWSGFLAPGQVMMVDFEFAPASGVVEGHVLLDGEIPERATLSLLVYSDAGEEGRMADAAPDGQYRFEAVPEGPVSLTVDAEDAVGRLGFDEARFRLQDGETRRSDFNLKSIAGTGDPEQE